MKRTRLLNRLFLIPTLMTALAPAVWLPASLPAQDYLGASNVLRQAAERNAAPAAKSEKDESAKLRDDLKLFSDSVTNLAPADAAKGWLELVDRAAKVQQQQAANYSPYTIAIQADDLLGALPPPVAWNELARAVAARPPARSGGEIRESGLRLLAAALTGDSAGRSSEITNLQARARSADQQENYLYLRELQQIGEATLSLSDDPDAILKSLGYQLAYGNDQGVQQLQVPNLVSLIGPEKTEVFLRKALVVPNVALQFNAPNETSRLAQKLALELIDQLKTAQWGLVNSLDAVALYEAMDKRFGTPTNQGRRI